MVRKEDVDFYCGFTRKDLQSLCKRYNLPANRSTSDMAESLASYVENISMNSVAFGVAGNSATTSRPPMGKTWDVKRDSYGNKLDKTRENCVQGAVARGPGSILGDNTPYHQERNGNGSLIDSSYVKKLNEKAPIENSKKDDFRRTDSSHLENRMKEVADSGESPSSSSFEFHVSLEEGINLSVDLNFNPSDWIKSMRDEVNVYDSLRRRKFPHSSLGINDATECKKQKSSGKDKDKHARKESSLSPVNKDNTQLPSHHHSNGEQSLASSAIEPHSRIKDGSYIFQENNGVNLSVPDSSRPGQVASSCLESYSKSCCVNPPGKELTSGSVMVTADPAGNLVIKSPENQSMESLQKVGNSSTQTVICPRGGGSELSSSEAEAYHSNLPRSPRKTNGSSNISSSELRDFTSYSESFKFRYNGSKNCLPPNTEEQGKSEVLSEQARSK